MNILIGLSGNPRSGKDTVADYLVDNFGFTKYSFAEYLKWLVHTYFGYPREELWGAKTEETRKLLQNLGKMLTDIDSNFLINPVIEKIKKDYEKTKEEVTNFRAVISDVRRMEELELFDRTGTKFLVATDIVEAGIKVSNVFSKILVVRLERDIETILKEEPGLAKNIKHPIESLGEEYNNWDYFIENNSDINALENSLKVLMEELQRGEGYDCYK